jgi:periplasmic protein CpxP/Spy
MNNSNNRWLTVITLLLLTANIVTLALLWTNKKGNDEGRPPMRQGQAFEFLTHELKLDSAQQETYRKLRDEHRDGQRPIQDSIRKAKDEFFALLREPNVPDSMIKMYSRRAVDAQQRLDEFTFRHFQKLRAICNDEQKKRFDEIIQDALRMMAPPRRHGPPPPGEGHPPPPGD